MLTPLAQRIFACATLLSVAIGAQDVDPRDQYDVQRYDLVFAVQPEAKRLDGAVTVHARALVDGFSSVQLDLKSGLEVQSVSAAGGAELKWEHAGDSLVCELAAPVASGDPFELRVQYGGSPGGRGFSGFHWARTESGAPWINTSCQGPGAHMWWPCKASYYNPDDKPDEGTTTKLVVPADLYGVTNGRLVGITEGAPEWLGELEGEWKTYEWRHPYPLETYTVTLNVAPYVVVQQDLELSGIEGSVPFIYYVLPENAEKAALQFQEVPRLIEIYSEAFGPWPFPKSKFGLVETNFWGMEHSTAVAYGSSYPAWCQANGVQDRYEGRNRFFDYILIHEVAHEWWGNAVSAEHWGHFWVHEGFGTYAEGVYVEFTQGRERADEYFLTQRRGALSRRARLYRGDDPESGKAYSGVIYSKGAMVLNTLRHYVADDEAWWKSLREFNLEFRYGNATTEDFAAVLERNTGTSWERFFREWFYGPGVPTLTGNVEWRSGKIRADVKVEGDFTIPLDLAWTVGSSSFEVRAWLEPGDNKHEVKCDTEPDSINLPGMHRILARMEIKTP